MQSPHFYKQLKTINVPLREIYGNTANFTALPEAWSVLMVDIKASAAAVERGLHNDVNLVATGSIITVLNTLKSTDVQLRIPYFFRGDGATFLVPGSVLDRLKMALEVYRNHISRTLQLNLNIGHLQVAEVCQKGKYLNIAKLQLNKFLVIPIIQGNGLKKAEQLIRAGFTKTGTTVSPSNDIDLQGMECRWDEILPNGEEKKVICLVIVCKDGLKQSELFTKILDEMDFLFGDLNHRTPVSTSKLKLDNAFSKMRKEMFARLGVFDRRYLVQNWLITYFGTYYFKFFKGGKDYLFRVTQLSDTLVMDGAINTVFSGTERQIGQLQLLLDSLENDGKILYGMHSTYASIMSCYIEDRDENHIHFVDGTEGGYIKAKAKLQAKLQGSPGFPV